MSIIDPRTGKPLTADTASTNTADTERAPVRPEDVIVELDASNIQQVLEASMQVPVLLGCYSPADSSCATLLTVLEKLALEYAGTFLLGKLNTDANPEISAQLGVRAVPDVKLVSQGGLVDNFQGALPEKEVREWLGRYFPAPADAPESPEEQAEAALEQGDTVTAHGIYQDLVTQYPEHYAYQVAFARVLVAEGRGDEARSVLENLPPKSAMAPQHVAYAPALRSVNKRFLQKTLRPWMSATIAKRSSSAPCAKWPMVNTMQGLKHCLR